MSGVLCFVFSIKNQCLKNICVIRKSSDFALAGIALLLAIVVSPAVQAVGFPAQKLFSSTIYSPTLYFQTGQAGCEYIASQSKDGNGFYHYTNPLWISNDPQWGDVCQFSYYSMPGSTPRLVSVQNWILPAGDSCPRGYALSGGVCSCADATKCPKALPVCEADGNPILRGYGIKRQMESDYTLNNSLRFERVYNSVQGVNDDRLQAADVPFGRLGKNWLHTYSRVIDIVHNGPLTSALIYRPDGGLLVFQKNGGSWVPEADVTDQLTQQTDSGGNPAGWIYRVSANDEVETYNEKGILLAITNRAGVKQTLTYSTGSTPAAIATAPSLLINVIDSFGRQLNFTYDNKIRLKTMTDSNGGQYLYSYNGNNTLASVQYPDNRVRIYLYDESAYSINTLAGALTGITDENGQRFATFTYANNKAKSTSHAEDAEKYSLVYGSNQSTVTDPLGSIRTYSFQTTLGVVRGASQSQPGGAGCGPSSSAVSYDANGNAESRTDFNGNKTTYVYDLTRNLETSRTEALTSTGATTPQTHTITTTWHATYRLPLTITEPGKTTAFTYDSNGNQLSKTITDTVLNKSRTWTYTYNTLGQVLTTDGPRTDVADVTTYTYYAAASSTPGNVYSIGDLATVTNAVGHVTSITNYDLNGRPLSITDPNGIVTTMTYAPRGWLKSRTVNGVQTTTYDYDGVGQLIKATLPDGSYLGYTYDAAHRLTDIVDNAGNRVHYTLDAMGNRTREDTKDPGGNILKARARVFDTLNRLQQDVGGTSPATQVTAYGYDNNGNLKTITDALSRITTHDYDPLNRLITITDPATPTAGVTRNDYNARDQLVQVKDPRLVTTDYTVDALGNAVVTQSPDSGTATSLFDAAGNVIQKTDARGVVSQYTYDALNRLAEIAYPANPADNVSFYYDYDGFSDYSKGHLSYINDADGFVIVGTYDPYGNILNKADWISTVAAGSEYTYDNANRLASILYPSGRVVTYIRNSLGQVTQVQLRDNAAASPQTLVGNITYKPFGPISSMSFGNGVDTTLLYDADYRVTRITVTSTPNWDYLYHYDAVGNIDQLTDQMASNDREYAYDALDRIIQDKKLLFGAAGLVEYQYDLGGNRTLWKQLVGQPQTYAPTSNRQTQYGSTSLTQDGAGNLTGYGTKTFSYDSANRMSQSVVGATTTAYRYNGLGQRTTRLATTAGNTVVTYYGYDPGGKYLGQTQVNPDGTYAQGDEYIWLDDMPIAQVHTVYGANNTVASQQLTYIHADHLNTPRAMTDASRKIVWKWESEAYGRTAPSTDPDGDGVLNRLDLRFPGQIADAETGLFYGGYRYYDPVTGRFTQFDLIGPIRDYSDPVLQVAMNAGIPLLRLPSQGLEAGLNQPYAYGRDNPISNLDRFGLENGDIWNSTTLSRWNNGDNSAYPSTNNNERYKACYASCMDSYRPTDVSDVACDGVGAIVKKIGANGVVSYIVKKGCGKAVQQAHCSTLCSEPEKCPIK